ncbi:MAG: hypothetical protein A3D96_00415 [Chlamydiae bacterium RIFCSPHIGHO2_12_FULL_44_59]|nr:MAG: hypothetical protein A2796_07560 [Chlamydiae bacterium RIFCSPHIGHO2_01_FULL_44_39]OGN60844.1 MAG: hypothetical protein A3D96_00415 [Chlamydiae bacterium RIFCSPHIGHO2_12_FULL_44_59]
MMRTFLPWLLASLTTLSAFVVNNHPSLGMNADGEVVVIWQNYDRDTEDYKVQGATFSIGESWSAPVTISGVRISPQFPSVALNASGDMFAVWQAYVGRDLVLESATGLFVSGWDASEVIGEATGQHMFPDVGVDASGNAIAVCQAREGTFFISQATLYNASLQSWGEPAALNTPTVTMPLPVAVMSNAVGFSVWSQYFGAKQGIECASISLDLEEEGPIVVSDRAFNANNPEVAVNGMGTLAVVWERAAGSSLLIEAIVREGGDFGEVSVLSSTSFLSANPIVAINENGTAVVVWQSAFPSDITKQVIQAAMYVNGSWGVPKTISSEQQLSENPRVAINASGEAVFIWEANNMVQTAFFSSATITTLSDPTEVTSHPQIGIDSMGNAVAVWDVVIGDDTEIRAAVFSGGVWGVPEVISQ